MRELLAEDDDVLPLYAQIAVLDAGTADIPEWESGEEKAVASEHAVLVATRPDHLGNVHVQVFRGEGGPDLGLQVFDGELSVVSGRIAVGSVVADQLLEVETGDPGYVAVKVFVQPAEQPERVAVVLSGEPVP
jgi:hypothetical protein